VETRGIYFIESYIMSDFVWETEHITVPAVDGRKAIALKTHLCRRPYGTWFVGYASAMRGSPIECYFSPNPNEEFSSFKMNIGWIGAGHNIPKPSVDYQNDAKIFMELCEKHASPTQSITELLEENEFKHYYNGSDSIAYKRVISSASSSFQLVIREGTPERTGWRNVDFHYSTRYSYGIFNMTEYYPNYNETLQIENVWPSIIRDPSHTLVAVAMEMANLRLKNGSKRYYLPILAG
jgi:hypothetical protein